MQAVNIENVKEMRVELSALYNTLKQNIEVEITSRHTALAITHLEEGRMALGDVLAYLQEPSPYNHNNYAPADVTEDMVDFGSAITLEERIRLMRDRVGVITSTIAEWYGMLPKHGSDANRFIGKMGLRNAYTGTRYCRLWLGMLLGQLKKDNRI